MANVRRVIPPSSLTEEWDNVLPKPPRGHVVFPHEQCVGVNEELPTAYPDGPSRYASMNPDSRGVPLGAKTSTSQKRLTTLAAEASDPGMS